MKIAIVGSCLTRDNFNSKFNANYKMFFECVAHQHQANILSLMSDAIPTHGQNLDKYTGFRLKHFRSELTKEFLEELSIEKPEYLLIDLYGDIYCGAIELGNGNYLTNNTMFKGIPVYDESNGKIIRVTDGEYFDIFKKKFNDFYKYVMSVTPKTKIVIVKNKFGDKLSSGHNLSKIRLENGIPIINVKKLNELWEKYNSFLINQYKFRFLDMTDNDYLLSDNHPWGKFYVHYTTNFYRDFFNKLQKIAVDDYSKKIIELEKSNKRLKKKVKFYENESVTHLIKRNLLKVKKINQLNNYIKGRT
ncbi:DUF6270 domain-containing protein [Virgibacillus sp. Bac332]|uniref:DUF6270 domain-containing protein n=1 Tax=Virgibacillus sp. Bac332 TaxID=2419842 RepID=UPI000EF4C2FC|nr:DUF6270 domain-containing protein [Virgibacillus sp. Bac332]